MVEDKENMVSVFIMEYYLVSGKKILWFSASWINLDNIMLSEISYAWKDKLYDFTYRCNLRSNS